MIIGILDRFIGWIRRELTEQMFNHNYMEYRRIMKKSKNQKNPDEWLQTYMEIHKDELFPDVRDKEGEMMTLKLNEVFAEVDDQMKGEFSKKYDGYLERDSRGKLHLHVFEI